MSADRMKRRRKKLESKRGVNMSFSELVQRIGQRGTPAPQQDLVERPERKKATSPKEKSSARMIAAIAGVPVGIASIIVTNAYAVTSEECGHRRRVKSGVGSIGCGLSAPQSK
jgi:hypothetical protein